MIHTTLNNLNSCWPQPELTYYHRDIGDNTKVIHHYAFLLLPFLLALLLNKRASLFKYTKFRAAFKLIVRSKISNAHTKREINFITINRINCIISLLVCNCFFFLFHILAWFVIVIVKYNSSRRFSPRQRVYLRRWTSFDFEFIF